MLSVLNNRTYRHLFTAQVIALVGTGLMTVALGLLAYELAGADAGAVLGTALAIKMLAYAGVAPVAQAFADRLPRRSLLVALDLVRAAVALCLPFVTEVWQIYVLVFAFAIASATFSFAYLAAVPYLLGSQEDYTRSLARSRIAAELEGPLSPLIAAGLLLMLPYVLRHAEVRDTSRWKSHAARATSGVIRTGRASPSTGRSSPSSASVSLAARFTITLPPSLTVPLSFTATGASFCGVTVRLTVAVLDSAPATSSMV